jgi:hypothetical protein
MPFLQYEYEHEVVNHAETYVNGQIHTNGIENFWSLLKRGLHGTYVAVEPYHLSRPGKFLRDWDTSTAPRKRWIDVTIDEMTAIIRQLI